MIILLRSWNVCGCKAQCKALLNTCCSPFLARRILPRRCASCLLEPPCEDICMRTLASGKSKELSATYKWTFKTLNMVEPSNSKSPSNNILTNAWRKILHSRYKQPHWYHWWNLTTRQMLRWYLAFFGFQICCRTLSGLTIFRV